VERHRQQKERCRDQDQASGEEDQVKKWECYAIGRREEQREAIMGGGGEEGRASGKAQQRAALISATRQQAAAYAERRGDPAFHLAFILS